MQSEYPVPIKELRRLLSYDPNTGVIIRLVGVSSFTAGSVAGCPQKDYHYIEINKRRISAHRIAWALHYGVWPSLPIDHINLDRFDNRIENLRLASVAENNRNRPKQSNNTTGYKGVTLHKKTGKFCAKIMANKVRYSLGYYETAEEAAEAYKKAALRLHGDFAHV